MKGLFSPSYYRAVVETYGYDPVEFSAFNFCLGTLNTQTLSARWLCHSLGDQFSAGLLSTGRGIVTTGFGLSGTPHLGSVSQMLGLIALQKAGLLTQIVLGDLDAYNARGQDLDAVRSRVRVFSKFLVLIGYDPKNGILRDQYQHLELLREAFLFAQKLKDSDFADTEEDLSQLYKERGVYPGIEFPVKLSILLMITDFLALVPKNLNVMVMLGIDEHRYVRLAQRLRNDWRMTGVVSAIYTRVNKGLKGFPKMSKSIPESAIHLDMKTDDAVEALRSQAQRKEEPHDSALLQLMVSLGIISGNELSEVENHQISDDATWRRHQKRLIEFVISLLEKWKAAKALAF